MKQQQTVLLIAGLVFLTGGMGLLAAKYISNPYFSFSSNLDQMSQLKQADEYLRQNSTESSNKAFDIFNRILSMNHSPRINALSRYGLALSLEKLNNYEVALEHYRELKKQNIDDKALAEKIDYSLGKLYLFIDHEEEGRSLLEPLIVKTDNQILKSKIHEAFAGYFLRKGDRQRAASNYRVALKYNPENLKAQIGKAEALKGSKTDWLAYEYYDDYLIGDSWLDPVGRQKMLDKLRQESYDSGIQSFRKGELERAEHYFQRVLSEDIMDELNEKARYWLAESYQKDGKPQLAIQNYDMVLQNNIQTMDQPALIKKGIILFNQNKMQQSAKAFQMAIDDYPNGGYTERAIEWKREIQAQLQEKHLMRSLN